MKYMGSKNRIASEILPIILEGRKPEQWYVEPFAGGCNLIDKVDGNRIASDSNEHLIELFRALDKGWQPPDFVSEDLFKEVKTCPDLFSLHFIAFVRFGCSFGSDWNGGYARNVKKDAPGAEILNSGAKSYCRQSKNNMLRQIESLRGVRFENRAYSNLYIPDNSIVYCDPPYAETTQYAQSGFDSGAFWQWARDKSLEGHSVFVSEYTAPEDFYPVWEKEIPSSLNNQTGSSKKATEKLFVFNDIY
jgi:DNA adenine methylase